MRHWSVVRTRSRWEKKVSLLLTEKGVETFCPLVNQRRQWSDRVKIIILPLFKSHLFVRISDEQRTTVRLTEGVMNFVYRDGKPVAVKEKMIEEIRQFQKLYSQAVTIEARNMAGKTPKFYTQQSEEKGPATLWVETLDVLLIASIDHG